MAVAAETLAWLDPMMPVPMRVGRVRRETHDTVTLELEPPGAEPFRFAAGQFNMLYAFGVGEVPISISGDPTSPGPLVHTVREVGPVSGALCRLKAGGMVGVRGPFGADWGMGDSVGGDVVIVAGGIGLAPLRPALYQVLAHREAYGNAILLYGARTPQDLLYRRELASWRARFDLQVEVTVDAATPQWRGHVGVVTTLFPRAEFDPSEAVALVVGPEIMMRFAIRALLDRGIPPERVRLSMERSMKCGIGQCGHCQVGPFFVCGDGPVFAYDDVRPWLEVREL